MIIKLPENLTEGTIGSVKTELASSLAKYPSIALDFSEVKKMDSHGLEMLLECTNELARRDGAIRISGMSPEAATFLEITRMDRIFEMFPSIPAGTPVATEASDLAKVSSAAQVQISAA
jgi:anti-anti-sigma factor